VQQLGADSRHLLGYVCWRSRKDWEAT